MSEKQKGAPSGASNIDELVRQERAAFKALHARVRDGEDEKLQYLWDKWIEARDVLDYTRQQEAQKHT
jgi:hypothetical protein